MTKLQVYHLFVRKTTFNGRRGIFLVSNSTEIPKNFTRSCFLSISDFSLYTWTRWHSSKSITYYAEKLHFLDAEEFSLIKSLGVYEKLYSKLFGWVFLILAETLQFDNLAPSDYLFCWKRTFFWRRRILINKFPRCFRKTILEVVWLRIRF